MVNPEIFVLSGPNGAGKSTTAKVLLPESFNIGQFVNADDIAAARPGGLSAIEAGRIMLERIKELYDRGETFAFETTLAARSYARFLEEAKASGYLIHLLYVWLSNVDLAKKRVAVRVRRGGHDVPAQDIERRYWRGLKNFFDLYRPLADTWALCDNSGRMLRRVAYGGRGQEPTVLNQAQWDKIQASLMHARKHT